ncbi:hypothetical protein [Aspergillus fumigatus narnavirus 2]|nr:hypothetical protein [Aspergillus fumigatus narnavirus 2]
MAQQRRNAGGPNFGAMLNLERVPPLAPKFANQIGKTCTAFRVVWGAKGTTVEVHSTISPDGREYSLDKEGNPQGSWIGIAEWERRRALRNSPSEEEKKSALMRKYELRLNKEFPKGKLASGKDADIQAFMATLPFAERRALLMSQKDFAKSYPEGFRAS